MSDDLRNGELINYNKHITYIIQIYIILTEIGITNGFFLRLCASITKRKNGRK